MTPQGQNACRVGYGSNSWALLRGPLGGDVKGLSRGLEAARLNWREATAFDALAHRDPDTFRDIGVEPWRVREVAWKIAAYPGIDFRVQHQRP